MEAITLKSALLLEEKTTTLWSKQSIFIESFSNVYFFLYI